MKEVTPPPPSPRSASCNSQEDVELESDTTKKDNESVMIRTSESVSRPTFWIPVDGSSAENNEPTRDPTVGEYSSNGTKFYINLTNLEALARGQRYRECYECLRSWCETSGCAG